MGKVKIEVYVPQGARSVIEIEEDDFVFVDVNGATVAGIDVLGGSIGTWREADIEGWERRIEIGRALSRFA